MENKDGFYREINTNDQSLLVERRRRRRTEPEAMLAKARATAERLETALLRYPPDARLTRGMYRSFVDRRSDIEGQLANPFAALLVQKVMGELLEAKLAQADNVFQRTFIDEKWDTTTVMWELPIRSIRQTVQRAQAHLNGVFTVEFAVHLNWRAGLEGSRKVTPHAQGIFWGQETERQRRHAGERFQGSANGAHGIMTVKEFYRPGMIAYAFKDPFIGYSTYQRRDGTFARQAGDLPGREMSRTFNGLRDLYWPDVIFAVGEQGKEVRDAFVKQWKARFRG